MGGTAFESGRHAKQAAAEDAQKVDAQVAADDFETKRDRYVREGMRAKQRFTKTEDVTRQAYEASMLAEMRGRVETMTPAVGDWVKVHRVGTQRNGLVTAVGTNLNVTAEIEYANGVKRTVKIPGVPKDFWTDAE